ncbi:ATP-binding protein [Ornithinibacillus sp. 4-3]|uniref:histidine kinase n=1 Tax=Ornithinibacillus sp. 4-3 TaxID=3231488 RepID=A0AB39HV89_9BACI
MIRKKILFTLLFIILLTSFRLIWLAFFDVEKISSIQDGQIHLMKQKTGELEIIRLSEDWEFYPDQLITPEEINHAGAPQENLSIQFPDGWFTYSQNQEYSYGTFRLQATLDEALVHQPLAFYMPRLPSAHKIYIDGKLVGESGNPATQVEDFSLKTLPYEVIFQAESSKLDILIQVSHLNSPINYSAQPLLFGTASDIYSILHVNMLAKIIVIIFTLLFASIAIFLFCMKYRPKLMFYFGLLMTSLALMVYFDPEGAVLLPQPMGEIVRVKLNFCLHVLIMISLFKFRQHFLAYNTPKILDRSVFILIMAYSLFVLIAPISIIFAYQWLLGIIGILNVLLVVIQVIKANKEGLPVPDAFLLILAGIAVFNNVIWAFLKHRMDLVLYFYPLDLLIALFLFTCFWVGMFLHHVKDIEEKNKKLHQFNKSRDDFLANTSHEMRNPLHSMIHIAQYVLDNRENKIINKDRQDLMLLIQVGKRMSMLINDLIDLSQIREHNLRLNKKVVYLHGQVKVVLDMLAHVIEGKPVQVLNQVSPSFPPIVADENRLNQILLNLVHNALKFTEEGTITIQAKVAGDMAVIEVIDTGKGIDNVDFEKIFHPYEQIMDEKKSYQEGKGLGLVITKELIELQGGTIHVESKLGKGSTFRFTLALCKNSALTPKNTNRIESKGKNVREQTNPIQKSPEQQFSILVVDDERINQTVISKILDRNRYEITFADSGAEALAYLNKQQFDLVISDVMMPMMSGFELTREIRKHYNLSELPVLLLTARARTEDLETGFLAGANDYVVKPIEPLELRARVRVLTDLKVAVTERLHMEAAWMRAQINPHFIFNTINAIFSLIEFDQDKMRELFGHFAYYLQTSFDFQNADHLVSLDKELNLVDAYLAIEQTRFGDRIHVHKFINVDSTSVLIPPLLLQTLVENAVQHGILNRQEGGNITIEAEDCGVNYEIRVKDDGVGIPEEVKEMLRTKVRVDKFGIGLWNTEKRLQQYAGEGLSITSEDGKGTTIQFQLPKK